MKGVKWKQEKKRLSKTSHDCLPLYTAFNDKVSVGDHSINEKWLLLSHTSPGLGAFSSLSHLIILH
jgi:hypothetical protein